MLKIKDNVDLKELENYGFKHTRIDGWVRYFYESDLDGDEIRIREDRIIKNWTCLELADDSYCVESPLEEPLKFKIEDLIKDGLVEKVGGKE